MSAEAACARVSEGVQAALPTLAETRCLPLADGGDGTASILARHLHAQAVQINASDALHRPGLAQYFMSRQDDGNGPVAIIESASAIGLADVAVSDRDPLLATSFGIYVFTFAPSPSLFANAITFAITIATSGLGEVLLAALTADPSPKRVIVCVGGTATNDASAGMAHALGYTFLDRDGQAMDPRYRMLCTITT